MSDTMPESVMVRFSDSDDTETAHSYFSAAHVAAEVAAERARCVVPEVVRRGIRYAINSTRYIGARAA